MALVRQNAARLVPLSPVASQNNPRQPLGSTGLQNLGGIIREQYIPELNGQMAARTYKRMGDYDPVCGAIVNSIDKLLRRVPWRAEAASSRPQDREAADFIETCMHDMANTWTDTVSEIGTCIQYGFSIHEKVFKRRMGNDADPMYRSRYSDGRIGWRYLPIRGQDTVQRWVMDDNGDLIGFEQLAPPNYKLVYIPLDNCMLFRTSSHKNNPEGRSIFLPAYEPWYAKRNIQAIEAIGIERDLAGLPVAGVPATYLSSMATAAQRETVQRIDEICANIRQDESASIIMPRAWDDKGNELFTLSLMSSGGARQFNTDIIVQRYDHRIALCALADFMLMGQTSSTTGSFSMHSDKTDLFGAAVSAYLDIIADTLQKGIDELIRINDFGTPDVEPPKLVHDELSQPDLVTIGDFLQKLAAAGMPLFPNPELEARLLEMAHLPKPLDYEAASVSLNGGQPAGPADPESLPDTPPPALPGAAGLPDAAAGANISADHLPQAADLIAKVHSGALPRDAALTLLRMGFGLTPEQAKALMGSAGIDQEPKPGVTERVPLLLPEAAQP